MGPLHFCDSLYQLQQYTFSNFTMSVDLSDAYDRAHQGQTHDYADPYTRGPLLLILSAVAIGIMYLFATVRFLSRLCIRRKLLWDDCESIQNDGYPEKYRCAHKLNSDLRDFSRKNPFHHRVEKMKDLTETDYLEAWYDRTVRCVDLMLVTPF